MLLAVAAGCAAHPPTPASPGPQAAASSGAPVSPPPLAANTPAEGIDPRDSRSAERLTRRAIFDGAWTLVRDKHYDKSLGGLDWNALRAKYEPLAMGAPDQATFYRFLNQMLGELRQSHLEVTGPGAPARPALDTGSPEAQPGGSADPGLTVRAIEGRATITAVRPGSPAERAGLRPGFLVTEIGGWPVRLAPGAARAAAPGRGAVLPAGGRGAPAAGPRG